MTTAVQIAQFYTTLLSNNKDSGANLAADVFYGDQTKIVGPRTLCVEPAGKENAFTRAAAARSVKRTFTTYIYVYANAVVSDSDNRLTSDLLAESVEDLIHKHPTCGGLVINALVTNIEPGYVTKQTGTTYVASRLTITSSKEEYLPASEE